MVLINVLVITLILGIILISLGFHFKKRALFLSLAGSILFLIIGLNLFLNGLSIPAGSDMVSFTEANETMTTTIIIYEEVRNTSITILSWVITLIGFAGFIGSSISLNKNRFDEGDDEAEDF